MSQKLTSKQEKFCQLVAAGGGLSESYRGAYSTQNMKTTTVNRNAKLLADKNKIATRIEALQVKHAKRHEITVDDLVAELEEAEEALGRAMRRAAFTGLQMRIQPAAPSRTKCYTGQSD